MRSRSAARERPDHARHDRVRSQLRNHAAAHERELDLGVLGHEAEVAGHREGDADADRMAVDGGEHGLAHLAGPERVGEVARLRPGAARGVAGPEAVSAPREVRPGTEGAARAGDHHGAHAVVGLALAERPLHLVAMRAVPGVQRLRAVQRQRRDADGVALEADRLIGRLHRGASAADGAGPRRA